MITWPYEYPKDTTVYIVEGPIMDLHIHEGHLGTYSDIGLEKLIKWNLIFLTREEALNRKEWIESKLGVSIPVVTVKSELPAMLAMRKFTENYFAGLNAGKKSIEEIPEIFYILDLQDGVIRVITGSRYVVKDYITNSSKGKKLVVCKCIHDVDTLSTNGITSKHLEETEKV